MKVYLGQKFAPSTGGVYRVLEGLLTYLPAFGVDVTDDISQADVAHVHIGLYEDISPDMPLIVSSHGMLWDQDGWGQIAQVTNKKCVEAYHQADLVTAPSQFVADTIAKHTLVKPRVIRHGIDLNRWLPTESKGYVLWNKSRIDPANRPEIVNELAVRARHTSFVTTYGTPTTNVHVIGQQSPEEMWKYVREAGVYLDTPKESGGPCFGVLEAMACQVPVLAWNNGGNAESILHQETGYLAEVGNYADLHAGLIYCLEHRQRLGQNARQWVQENYTWDHIIPQYIQAYEDAANPYPVKVSVIVPCYNLGKFLGHCLDSIQDQTYTDWECVVIDDASTDDSLEIARTYEKKNPKIRVLHHESNLHVSNARNNGIEASKGKYILPLDADDRLSPTALDEMVKVLDSTRTLDMVGGQLFIVHELDLTKGYQNNWPNPDADVTVEAQVKGHNQLPYSSMYRRKVWENVGGYRRRIRNGIEDADFWTRALVHGYKAKIIPSVTLYYTIREKSLGKENTQGTAAWASWFPQYHSDVPLPLGADNDYRVNPYDAFTVSVVIPVGPGHTPHIQSVLDSLTAQTELDWEAVVVNDTGQRWFDSAGNPLTQWVTGMPFVHFIDGDKNEGTASARNKGILAAKSDRIVFMDCDDLAQPRALEYLLQAHLEAGGWIYGDWYTQDSVYHDAPDWSIDHFVRKSLAPITGVYWKQDLIQVGLFDTQAPGWEDWDIQLSLLERGICGTRVKYPLITYNMHLGQRREDNFSHSESVLQYIIEKHPQLYKEKRSMGCSKCGGKASISPKSVASNTKTAEPEQILMKYTGPEAQTKTWKPVPLKGHPHATYRVNNQTPFWARSVDVPWFMSHKFFVRVETPVQITTHAEATLVPLTSDPVKIISWDTLELRPEVVTILKEKFTTVQEIINSTDAQLLTIPGIGPKRLADIRKAVHG